MNNIKDTNRTAEIANAREVDTRIAAEWASYYDKRDEARSLEKKVDADRKTADRMPRFAAQIEEGCKAAERRAKVLRAEAAVFLAKADEIEGNEYTGWTRFFLVQHIHNSTHCSSFRTTTRIGWLPSVSGLTEAEAVAEHGATLCTICFPSAPTELTTKQADPAICTGHRDYSAPSRTGFYTGNWATCTCGERVTLTSAGNLRKHKKA